MMIYRYNEFLASLGVNVNRPNLFIVGAMKSGTSSLHSLLNQHEKIFMCDPKEPCHFIDPGILEQQWPEMWEMGFWRSEEAYLKLFENIGDVLYAGESSTEYSKMPLMPEVAGRIAKFESKAKILYIMRDPVERCISHYWHMVEHRGEIRPPRQAFNEDSQFSEVSDYALQLKPYFSNFESDQIYTLTFESLKLDALSELNKICSWLQLSAFSKMPADSSPRNVTPKVLIHPSKSVVIKNVINSDIVQSVKKFLPRQFINKTKGMIESRVEREKVDMSDVVEMLRKTHLPKVEELSELTGRSYPEWKILYGR